MVNFKEILFIRANKTRTSLEFGKDISDPTCTLNVTTPVNTLSLQRGDGHSAVAVSNDVVAGSHWQLVCPSYDSGWNVF
ncbi:hypothetical protein DKM44_06060 [Deinococcus irradiatisoli]|uniref:Uncharacterized protein n=1 Tax=Deinococcus irradiatisoli TaxID=2202254 RepID=A0A2Z3JCF7_9DEIO|nr:hypothetical protein DKM44_06060 [Deinococcus irradiatisoli]